MKQKRLITLTLLIIGLAFVCSIGAVCAADDNSTATTSVNDGPLNSADASINTAADSNTTDASAKTDQSTLPPDPIISGQVTHCGSTDPFPGVTVTVSSLSGAVLASAVTDANGLYHVAFLSNDTKFNVKATYPGHIDATKQVAVAPRDPSDPNKYATANFQMGTLVLTKGSTDDIGLDSNNVNVGPNHFMIQIHVKNNAATTATNVTGTLNFTSANANIFLDPNDTAVKSLGNIAPGATVDLFYLINVNRTAAAYGTTRNYTITVQGTNTGSADTITGTLVVRQLISQNRNHVVSIVVTPPNPTLGSNFAVTVTSTTSSPNFDWVDLSLINYEANIISPVSVTISYDSTTTNSIFINAPGATSFVSQWIFKAVGTGSSQIAALILDHTGNSFHYNTDFTNSEVINVTPEADLAITKTVNNTNPNVGQNVTFTLTASNLGPDNATGVTVNDLLPAGLSFVSATPSTGSYNSGTGVWTIGNFANGATATLTIVATVTQAGLITNTAHIQGNEDDPNPLNNQDSVALNGQAADLAIAKSVDNPTPFLGDNVTFTISLQNNGPNDAANVTVNDLLPAGFTLVSATPSRGTYNTGTGVWTIGTMIHGASETLILVATTTQSGLITNTAQAFTTTFDPTTPNIASATVDVQPSADLAITKTVNNTAPNVGQNVTWTLTASNNGPSNATGVTVDDLLPAGLSYVSSSASQGSYNSVTGVWTIGNLANGGTATLNIVTTVTQTGQINNIATITGNEHDPNTLNNQAIASIKGEPTADLAITKTADQTVLNNGDNVTFTITVFNAGPNDATGTVVNDLLPAGLTFVSANPSQGSYNPVTGVWTIGLLLSQASATMTLTANTTQVGFFTNIAVVSSEIFDPHPEDNTASATVQVLPSADLAITKTVNNQTPNVGQNVTFTLTASNLGPDDATGVSVADSLPAGLTYVSSNASVGSYNPGTGVWTIGNLANGASAVLTIVATVTQTGQINNVAVISGNENDPNPLNNQAIASINGQPTADLAVQKTVDQSMVNNGDTVTFTISVFNAGPNTATGTVVNDLLPAGLSFVSANPSQGSYNPVTGVWTIGTLLSQASANMTVVAHANQVGLFTNIAVVSSDVFDPDPDDNTSSATVNVQPSADLAITKTVNDTTPNVGQNVTFTLTASNLGPDDATGVSVADSLPAGLTYVSSNASVGSYNPGTGVWTIGNLANGASAVLTIVATVTQTGQINNIATISGNENDPNPLNNQAIASINGQPTADLAIQKTVDSPVVNNGDNVTFTITVFNAGPNDAMGTVVNDLLPAGLTFVSANPSQGSYNPGTGVWSIGLLLSQTTATMTLTANTTQVGLFTNIAVVSSDVFDPHPDDNTSSATVLVMPSTDLAITKTVNDTTPNVGQNVTWTLIASNLGPDDATGVIVNDPLPAGLTFVSSSASVGSYNPATGVWTIGNLANGASATLSIVTLVNQTGQINNIAVISGNENDPNPLNNQAIASINGQPTADLAVQKTVDSPVVNNGDNVNFTITVFNAGPNTATGTVVNDLLPAGLTFVSANPSQGSYNPGTGVWSIGLLLSQASATMTLTANTTQVGLFTNIAVVSSDVFDPDPDDNTSSATVNVQPSADLAITKTVNDTTPNVGQNVTFTLTASNLGPDDATGVSVADSLPAGLTYVSSNASVGSYNPGTGVWTIGNLANGLSAVLTIVATVTQTGQINNIATISGNENDPNPLNNQAIASINGQPTADLAVQKTVDQSMVNNGDTVTFTISVFNAGPNTATGTVVNDLLPAGLSFVSANLSQGSYNPVTGVWTIGTLLSQASANMTVVAHATQVGLFTNIAVVSSDVFDPHHDDNTSSATVQVMPSADLAITKTVNDTTPNVGQNVTWTLTASNLGPDNATGVTVNDPLPAGLTFVSSSASVGSYNPGTGVWTIGNLANAASATLTIVTTVTQTGQINNIATISGNENDPNPLNNQDIAVINGQPTADLAILKTVNNNLVNNGDNVTFTISVFNAGPNDATGTVVNDLLPAGLTFVSALPSQGTYNPITGVWDIGLLPHQLTVNMLLTALTTQTGIYTNTAVVSSEIFDPNPEDNTSSATVDVLPSADLAIIKEVNDTTPNVGQNVTFTLTASNLGPDDATGVNVLDSLPTGLTYVSSNTLVGSYNPGTGVWTIGNLANGANAVLTIVATVTQSGQINNIAVISGNENDPNPLNNQDIATLNGQLTADLAILKTADTNDIYDGFPVTFTISVFNAGPSDATGTVVNDLLPDGLDFISATPSQGTYNPITGVWTIGLLPHQSTATLTLVALTTRAGSFTNTAVVTSEVFDPHPDDNTSSVSITVEPGSDLDLVKTVDNPTPNVGDNVTFTLTLTNLGPDPCTGTVVNDLLPAGLNFVSANPSFGTYDPILGVWTIGDMGIGETVVMTLVAHTTALGEFTNTGVASSQIFDPDTTNNTSSATVDVLQSIAALDILKTVNDPTPDVGDLVTFTITVTNDGPDTALNVVVNDLLPAGLDYVSSNASVGTYNPITGIWTIGDILFGNTETLTIVAEVTAPGTHTNTATVSSDTFNPNPPSSSVTVDVPEADLAIVKTTDKTHVFVEDLVTFTLTVTNLGPDAADDVVVNDVLPAGFEFVSSNASVGSYNPLTGVWTIGDMLAGDVETLTIVAEAEIAGTWTNTAVVSSDTFDPNLANNTSSVTVVVSEIPTPTPQPVNAKTVPMQPTGAPILPLVTAVLMVMAGLLTGNKRR